MRHALRIKLMVSFALLLTLAAISPVHAATTTLTTCNASELINAINSANADPGADTIELKSGCTYTLTAIDNDANGLPLITTEITIQGNGSTIARSNASGTPRFRLIRVHRGTLSLDHITLAQGNVESFGGAIYNSFGTVQVANSTLINNLETSGGGGGIYNYFGTVAVTHTLFWGNYTQNNVGGGVYNFYGTLTLDSSTFFSNSARLGAALANQGTGSANLTNVTLSANFAREAGGGIWNVGTISLNNSTVVNNTVNGGSATRGGGLDNEGSGSFKLSNTIVARNVTDGPALDCAGTFTSQGYNLIKSTGGCTVVGDSTGNQYGVDPEIGNLRFEGRNAVHALLYGSPAIDAGNPAPPGSNANACATTDERGIVRPQDGNGDGVARCDIGAYELVPTVQDYFNRTRTDSWGSANIGGYWGLSGGPASDFDVNGAAGTMLLEHPNVNLSATLMNISALNFDATFRVKTDKPSAGGGQAAYFIARRVAYGYGYLARLRFPIDGTVRLEVAEQVNGHSTLLGREVTVPGLTHAANVFVRARVQVAGRNPTVIRMKAWADVDREPRGWAYTVYNSSPSLQSPAPVGLRAYLSYGAANSPVLFSFDDLLVVGAEEPPNEGSAPN